MLTLEELKEEIDQLKKRYILKWIPADPSHAPQDFQYDVKSYCVLAHAVFEDYVEGVAICALKLARDAWLNRRFSRGTVALLAHYSFSLVVVDDEDGEQELLFDQVRKGLDDCVKNHSVAISNNHGFSLKYLRSILTPVGIDVPKDVALLESLRELTEARGSFAHLRAEQAIFGRARSAMRPMTPEQAVTAIEDCYQLCVKIGDKLAELEVAQEAAAKPH